MATELARHKAAQAWCKETTSKIIMDPILAEAFAEILDGQMARAHAAEEALAECYCWDPELVDRNNPLGSPLKDCGKCAVCLAKLVVAKRKEQEAEACGDAQVHTVLDEMAKRKEQGDGTDTATVER